MDKQEPTVEKGLKAKILNSAVWLERIIYSGIGIIWALVLALASGDIGYGILFGIGTVIGFYVIQSFTLIMWATWGFLGKILAACMLGPGVGLVILGIGDLIRWVAYRFYKGQEPVYFAFSSWQSKSDKPVNPFTVQEYKMILELLAQGRSYSEIARALNMPESYIVTAKNDLYHRFGVNRDDDLIAEAHKKGELP